LFEKSEKRFNSFVSYTKHQLIKSTTIIMHLESAAI